ncbi:MAG: hypothetical protein ABW163_13090 [Luteimonas sp.]
MSKANPARPATPEDGTSLRDRDELPGTDEPALRVPRSRAALDHTGVDDHADRLDASRDDQTDDRDVAGRSFADDVRSDTGVETGEPE